MPNLLVNKNWTQRQLLFKGIPGYAWEPGGPDPIAYGAVLDPTSTSRNFETTSQTPYLYFTRGNYSIGGRSNDNDLIGCRSTLRSHGYS